MLPGYTRNNPLEVVLFDLDGTLLRVEMNAFIPRYVEGLAEHCREHAKPKKFIRSMLEAIRALIREPSSGEQTNEQRLYSHLHQQLALPEVVVREAFMQFADNNLASLQELVRPIPLARKIVESCLQRDLPLVLATNPVFPAFMIEARLRWGGLGDVPFLHLTSFENSRYCKPQSGYFQEILDLLQLDPRRCLMVGNDAVQDMAAASVGIETYLVDTWLAERNGSHWPHDHRGDHSALYRFVQESTRRR